MVESLAWLQPETLYVDAWAGLLLEGDLEAQHLGRSVSDASIPAALRRRLGPYGRMAISCGLGVMSAESDIVFCSRFGDVSLAYRLLDDLVDHNPISPAGFTLSVHNAVPAVMDLVRENRQGHTAIAAGSQSLSSGLLETWGRLAEHPEGTITFLYADYALPEIFADIMPTSTKGISLALTLRSSASEASLASIHLATPGRVAEAIDTIDSEVLARRLFTLLGDDGADSFAWQSRGVAWSIEKVAHEPH